LAVGVAVLGCAVWVLWGVGNGAYTATPEVVTVGGLLVAAGVAALITAFDD
jgi:hypothetical protein